MSTAVTTTTQPKTVKTLLASPAMQQRFGEILKERAPQFLAAVTSQAATSLAQCKPESVIAAAFLAATLDLPVNKELGYAWLVPYRDKGEQVAQFQIGYKGFVQLAQRSGVYQRLNACVIREGAFKGLDGFGEPIIDFAANGDPNGKVVGYFCGFKLSNGFEKRAYWSREQCEAHGKRFSKTYANGPWKTDFDAMALKTVIKHTLTHWGPMSVEIRDAANFDQAAKADIDSDAVYVDRADGESQTDDVLRAITGGIVESEIQIVAPTLADVGTAKTPAELGALIERANAAFGERLLTPDVHETIMNAIDKRSSEVSK
jgi:recombination protein RecT